METTKERKATGRKPKGSLINFLVESNVKIFKSRKKKSSSSSIYPFFKMNTGDSFEFPIGMYSRVYSSAMYHSKKTGIKFLFLKQDSEKYRVWRVK